MSEVDNSKIFEHRYVKPEIPTDKSKIFDVVQISSIPNVHFQKNLPWVCWKHEDGWIFYRPLNIQANWHVFSNDLQIIKRVFKSRKSVKSAK